MDESTPKPSRFRFIGWLFRIVPLLAVVGFLHFYLPGYDVVRIVGTDTNRMDQDNPKDPKVMLTRDVRFINAVRPDGEPAVYRNEDTSWDFPWYFKFDSGNMQAVAQDLASKEAEPQWVVIKHYGWRIVVFSMFPNAVDIERVAGPQVTVVPWLTLILLVIFMVAGYYAWCLWRNFLEKLAIDERFDNASNNMQQVGRWLRVTWRDLKRKIGG